MFRPDPQACPYGHIEGPADVRRVALREVEAHQRTVLARVYPSSNVDAREARDVMRVWFESFCADVGGDRARILAFAHVALEISGHRSASIEEYRLTFERDGRGWNLTELRNPSEFDRDG